MTSKKLIKDIGEDALIKRLARILGGPAAPGVTLGIGDDAAMTEPTPGKLLVSSTDILVEGVHFTGTTPPYLLGKKAVSISVSDVGAMGAAPRHLLVSIALPGERSVSFVDWLYRGIRDACRLYSVSVVGGNTSASTGPAVISTTVLAEVDPERAVSRSGANEGDIIYVTGTLGDSALGLKLLQDGYDTTRGPYPGPVKRHLDPVARVSVGRTLAGTATSMMDLSDGLWTDLGRLIEASGVGAVIKTAKLPLSEEFKSWVEGGGDASLAVAGGEDYELLFTAPAADAAEQAVAKVASEAAIKVTAIGEVVSSSDGLTLVGADGEKAEPPKPDFSHF